MTSSLFAVFLFLEPKREKNYLRREIFSLFEIKIQLKIIILTLRNSIFYNSGRKYIIYFASTIDFKI